MKFFIKLFFLLLLSTSIQAEETTSCCGDGGIIYGDKWAFLISAPKNWEMYSDVKDLNVNVAFFQNKEAINEKDAWMYVTVSTKQKKDTTLNTFIENDENKMREATSNLEISTDHLNTKSQFEFRKFTYSGEHQRVELVSYAEFQDWFYTLVLSVDTEQELSANKQAFIEMIDSFRPMLKSN